MKTKMREAIEAWNRLEIRRAGEVFDGETIARLLIAPDYFVSELTRADLEVLEPVFNLEFNTTITDGERTVELEGRLLDYTHLEVDDKVYLAFGVKMFVAGAIRVEDWLGYHLWESEQ